MNNEHSTLNVEVFAIFQLVDNLPFAGDPGSAPLHSLRFDRDDEMEDMEQIQKITLTKASPYPAAVQKDDLSIR